jgi:hypothetical protein
MSGALALVPELPEFVVEGRQWPLLPDGAYDAVFIGYECVNQKQFGGAPKVFLRFRLHDAGEYTGKEVYRAFRAKATRGRQIVLGRRSELYRTFCRVLERTERSVRPDRLSLKDLKRKLFRIRTRTVSTDGKKRPLPASMRYSVVDDIESIVSG